jgi:hypothetical protein
MNEFTDCGSELIVYPDKVKGFFAVTVQEV